MARILVIDNYDSFVYNLVQYLAQLGAEVDVWRNDDPRFADADWAEAYDGVLISPGPGTPESAGVCIDVVKSHGGASAAGVANAVAVTARLLEENVTERIKADLGAIAMDDLLGSANAQVRA